MKKKKVENQLEFVVQCFFVCGAMDGQQIENWQEKKYCCYSLFLHFYKSGGLHSKPNVFFFWFGFFVFWLCQGKLFCFCKKISFKKKSFLFNELDLN